MPILAVLKRIRECEIRVWSGRGAWQQENTGPEDIVSGLWQDNPAMAETGT